MTKANSGSEAFDHPADGMYQIEPAGEHLNREFGITQVIDQAARQSIVTRFNADASAGRLSHGAEMLIDRDHFKYFPDKDTVAYGWLTRLENREDGIYGRIRWTTLGQASVDGGEYRFFSTEYDPKDLTVLNKEKPIRVRPLRLDGLSLTNMPNNHGKPITNRAASLADRSNLAAPLLQVREEAARQLSQLAAADQIAHGGSVLQAWLRVMNRERNLCALAGWNRGGTASQPHARR